MGILDLTEEMIVTPVVQPNGGMTTITHVGDLNDMPVQVKHDRYLPVIKLQSRRYWVNSNASGCWGVCVSPVPMIQRRLLRFFMSTLRGGTVLFLYMIRLYISSSDEN